MLTADNVGMVCVVNHNDGICALAVEAENAYALVDLAYRLENIGVTCGLRGDLRETLRGLLDIRPAARKPAWWEMIAAYKEEDKANQDTRPGMTPRNVIERLNAH